MILILIAKKLTFSTNLHRYKTDLIAELLYVQL